MQVSAPVKEWRPRVASTILAHHQPAVHYLPVRRRRPMVTPLSNRGASGLLGGA